METVLPASESHAARRDRSIRLAVATSFLSKGGTFLLQLVSIPLAVRVLGREEFGVYATVNFTLGILLLMQVGVGPALAHGLSRARAEDDWEKQRELGSTAFWLMAGVALCAGLLAAALLLALPLSALYGGSFQGSESALRPALWLGLVLFLLMFVLNLTDRVREGHLEVAANNLWGALGNVGAAITVGVGIWFLPEVWFLVLAVHGTMALAKVGNTVALWRKHPLMIPRPAFFRRRTARLLFSDGLAFSACCLVTGLVEYNLCGWLIGRAGGPADVALYGVLVSLTIMQLGFVIMLSAPTWPAVAESLARGDEAWAVGAARRLRVYGMGFAICASAGLVLAGPWVLELWLGREFSGISRWVFACYGLYFSAHVWRHLNHTLMIGCGLVSKLVWVQLAESLVVALIAWPVLQAFGIPGLLLAMVAMMTVFTGWVLPVRVAKRLIVS